MEKDALAALTQKGKKKNVKVDSALVFDSLKIQSRRLTCSFPGNLNYADLKVDFSLIKSHFFDELINLNFPLVLIFLRTLPRPK